MPKQRISYVPIEKMDAAMQEEMRRCEREGTPRPESTAVRAHVPAAFWFFANSWRDLFRNGVLDHAIKELCRLYVSRSVQCEYCGNQRSVKATTSGALIEDHVKDLINFESSTKYDERQKAALSYAEAIAWRTETDDAFWDRLHRHFTEPELVELGSLPRGARLNELLIRAELGEGVASAELEAEVERRVAHVFGQQRDLGIDICNDGEQGRVGFQTY